jgi:hypothetical protein
MQVTGTTAVTFPLYNGLNVKMILKIPHLAHEWMHVIPAWLFGLHPYILPSWDRTRHDLTTSIRWMIITLFPAVCASCAVILTVILTWPQLTSPNLGVRIPASLHLLIWVFWLDLCYGDLKSILRFFRTGERNIVYD